MKDLLLIPNLLTLLRIILIFPALYFLEKKEVSTGAVIILVIFLTDFFDGFSARKLKQTSYIGAILDPVADKLVVLSFFTYLFRKDYCPSWYYFLILIRDISQLLSIPILLLWKGIQFKVKPKFIPKLGTALNFIVLGVSAALYFTEKFDDSTFYMLYLSWIVIMLFSSLFEIYILVTYIPRFIQIYRGTHDTFE